MDAWVSGTDRHAQNWAAVRDGNRRWLASSFDHGNALAFQERDRKREQMLADPAGLRRWAARGVNKYFSGKPTLVDLAHRALNLAGDAACGHWLRQLQHIDRAQVAAAVAEVPDKLLSDVGRSFAIALLMLNQERILDARTCGS